jgi:hypothetical protein
VPLIHLGRCDGRSRRCRAARGRRSTRSHDSVSGRRHHLDEVVSAGACVAAEAERVRTRVPYEVYERRNRKTRATVNQMLDRHLETLDVEPTTRTRYEGIIRVHLRPALWVTVAKEARGRHLDRFFARHVKHRTQREHECDDQCHVFRVTSSRCRLCARPTGCSTPRSRAPCGGVGSAAIRSTRHSRLRCRRVTLRRPRLPRTSTQHSTARPRLDCRMCRADSSASCTNGPVRNWSGPDGHGPLTALVGTSRLSGEDGVEGFHAPRHQTARGSR